VSETRNDPSGSATALPGKRSAVVAGG
jgi:hypothetical protein